MYSIKIKTNSDIEVNCLDFYQRANKFNEEFAAWYDLNPLDGNIEIDKVTDTLIVCGQQIHSSVSVPQFAKVEFHFNDTNSNSKLLPKIMDSKNVSKLVQKLFKIFYQSLIDLLHLVNFRELAIQIFWKDGDIWKHTGVENGGRIVEKLAVSTFH